MSLLLLIVALWGASAAVKSMKAANAKIQLQRNRQRQARIANAERQQREQARLEAVYQREAAIQARERKRQQRQAERDRQQRQKEQQRQEKARQQQEQAEADAAFYMQQLEVVSRLLNDADSELQRIEQAIRMDVLTRSYDSEQRHRKTRERIQKKILLYENQLHNLEKRFTKAKLTAEAV